MPPKKAAIAGAKEVAAAITASTLTTVSVFAPIVFVEGITRQLFSDMALTVTYSLGASREIDPFMTLSFTSLPVIPKLRLTTHGVFDVEAFRLV